MGDAIAIIFMAALWMLVMAWFTLFPTIGVFWLMGWLA